jgi:hypothetical protein
MQSTEWIHAIYAGDEIMEQSLGPEAGSVYQRDLPGGGYVKIDVHRDEQHVRTRVSVERRAKHERRPGHEPVVIAEAAGDHRSPAFGDLYRMATDNAAIARALLQIEGPQRAD